MQFTKSTYRQSGHHGLLMVFAIWAMLLQLMMPVQAMQMVQDQQAAGKSIDGQSGAWTFFWPLCLTVDGDEATDPVMGSAHDCACCFMGADDVFDLSSFMPLVDDLRVQARWFVQDQLARRGGQIDTVIRGPPV